MTEKVAHGTFLPSLSIAMDEGMYDNVSVMSAELKAIIMTLEHVMNYHPLIPNSQLL